MEFRMNVLIFLLLIFVFSSENTFITAQKCHFPAIFNFGDSNSDTGGAYSVNHDNILWPNSMKFGKKPFKRASDGRLIIDFLAKSLGLPYLNASMDTEGTSFRYGANFAVGGQRVNPAPNPDPKNAHGWDYHLDKQVSQFFDFKSRANNANKKSKNIYPNPKDFSMALYTIDIGQNDVNTLFDWKNASTILDYYTNSVKRLLNDGAKYMWIHNTGPLGCVPSIASGCTSFPDPDCTHDNNGCKVYYNGLSQAFNSELEMRVQKLKKEYPEAVITLVDIYSAKYRLITNNKAFDKELKFKYCCGNEQAYCGQTNIIANETVFGGACADPSKYISWDGKHYTEAANEIIAKQIIDGYFSKPRVAFSHACCREGKELKK